MAREQDNRAPAERCALVVGPAPDHRWLSEVDGEPSLDELLDDPIMVLLWRADGLEPATARAAVMGLQTLVKRASGKRRGNVGVGRVDNRHCRSLAA